MDALSHSNILSQDDYDDFIWENLISIIESSYDNDDDLENILKNLNDHEKTLDVMLNRVNDKNFRKFVDKCTEFLYSNICTKELVCLIGKLCKNIKDIKMNIINSNFTVI
jgi:hypothetical protein